LCAITLINKERYGFGFMDETHVAAARKSLNDEVLPRHLAGFEKLLAESPSGWIAGGAEPSIADFILVPRLQWLVEPGTNEGISPTLLEGYPKITTMMAKFMALPAIVNFYKTHDAHPK
jgi:glutathione S-transferase